MTLGMQRVFVSFASSKMEAALFRIRQQADGMQVFDTIRAFDETGLDPAFRAEFSAQLDPGVRGFGYWAWKPQVIKQVMDELKPGDCLLYADAGCHLNRGGHARLLEYFDLLTEDVPIVIFQNDPEDSLFGLRNAGIGDWPNSHWTKGDLIDHLGMRAREDVLAAQTYYATTFLMMKSKASLKLLDDWMDIIRHDWRLIDDSPSQSSNMPGFVEHRHDQAIFSLLCHDAPVHVLSACEIVYPKINGKGGDWKRLSRFPIHARRDRGKKKFTFMRSLLAKVTGA